MNRRFKRENIKRNITFPLQWFSNSLIQKLQWSAKLASRKIQGDKSERYSFYDLICFRVYIIQFPIITEYFQKCTNVRFVDTEIPNRIFTIRMCDDCTVDITIIEDVNYICEMKSVFITTFNYFMKCKSQ